MPFPIHLLFEIPKLIMAVFGTNSIQDAIDNLSVDLFMKQGLLDVKNTSHLSDGEFIKRELQRPSSQAQVQYNTILFYKIAIDEIQQQFIDLTNEKNRRAKLRAHIDMLTQAALAELARIDNLLDNEAQNQYLLELKKLLQSYLERLSNLGQKLSAAQLKLNSFNDKYQHAQASLNNILNNFSKRSSKIYQTAHQEHINNIGEQISAINQRTVNYENNLALAEAELASLSKGRQPDDPIVVQKATEVENYKSMVNGLKEIEQFQKDYQQEEKDILKRRVDFNEKTPAELKELGIPPKEATVLEVARKNVCLNDLEVSFLQRIRNRHNIDGLKEKVKDNPKLEEEVKSLELMEPIKANKSSFKSLVDESEKEISEINERLKNMENQKVEAQNEVDQIKSDMNVIAKKLGKPEFKDENKPPRSEPPQQPPPQNNFPRR